MVFARPEDHIQRRRGQWWLAGGNANAMHGWQPILLQGYQCLLASIGRDFGVFFFFFFFFFFVR
jgi:hypothetical protein